MIQVNVSKAGKKFQGKWVFRDMEVSLKPGLRYVVAGKNGSGKSTFLKMISGYLTPSEGGLSWSLNGQELEPGQLFRYLSMAAPYIEPIDEFTFPELIRFCRQFKSIPDGLTDHDIVSIAGLEADMDKPIRNFSSGMRQRVKLSLAIIPRSGLLLLDEPCSNLDEASRNWYADLMKTYGHDKTTMIASNHNQTEYLTQDVMITL